MALEEPKVNSLGLEEQQMQGMFAGPDKMLDALPLETRARMEEMLTVSQDPDEDKAEWANVAFLSDAFKKPVAEVAQMLPQYRDEYARQMFKSDQSLDNKAFYGRVGQYYQNQRDERKLIGEAQTKLFQGFNAGDEDWRVPFTAALSEMKGKPGYDTERIDLYSAMAERQWTQWKEAGEKFPEAVLAISDFIKEARAGTGETSPGMVPGAEQRQKTNVSRKLALDALATIPEDQQRIVVALANRAAAGSEKSDEGAMDSFAARLERGVGRFAGSAIQGFSDLLQRAIPNSAGLDEFAAERPMRKADRLLDAVILGGNDPFSSENWLGEAVLSIAESLPQMASLFHPAGIVANIAAFSEDSRGRFEDAGIEPDKAAVLGAVSSIPLTALNLVNSRVLFGKTATAALEQWAVKNVAGKTGVDLVQGYVKNILAQGAENTLVVGGTAALQELTEPAVQDIASLMRATIPGVEWSEELPRFAGAFPETLSQLVPLIIIGTGASTIRSGINARAYVQNETALRALGLKPEQVAQVMEAPTPEAAQDALQQVWKDKGTPDQSAIQEMNQQMADMEAEGGGQPQGQPAIPRKPRYRVSLGPDGYVVKDMDGNIVGEAKSPEMAAKIAKESAQGPRLPPDAPKAEIAPERDGSPVPGKVTALNKAEIDSMRALYNMDELPAPDRERFIQVLDSAKGKNLPASAEALAKDVVKNPRTISTEEHASMVLRAAEIQNQYENTLNQAALEIEMGNPTRAQDLQRLSENLLRDLDVLTEASDLAGTQAGRALSIRRMRVNRENYSLAKVVQRARIAAQKDLTPEQTEGFRKLTEQIAKQDERIAKLEADLQAKEGEALKQTAETFVSEGRARRRTVTSEQAQSRRKALKSDLAKLGYRVNDITGSIGLSVEAANIIAKIANTYIEEGISTLPDLVAKLKTDIPNLSDQDIYNSVGRRISKAKEIIVNEVKARQKELKKQAKLTAEINDAVDGIKTEKGKRPTKDSPEVAKLRAQLRELRLQADKTARDDAQLTRIHEKINEVQDQLDGGFRTIPKEKAIETQLITQAREGLAEIRKEMELVDRIYTLEEEIRTGEKNPDAKKSAITNDRIEALRQEIKKLRDQLKGSPEDRTAQSEIDRLARLYSDTQEWPKKKENSVRQAIREQRENPQSVESFEGTLKNLGVEESTASTLANVIKIDVDARQLRKDIRAAERQDPTRVNLARRKSISDKIEILQSQIDGGFRYIPENKNRVPDALDVATLRKEMQELSRLMRTEDAIADLEEQIRTGEFKVSAPEQRIIKNAQLEEALVKRKQLQREVNAQIEQMEKPTALRIANEAVQLTRALKATADMSAILRQGAILASRDPVNAAKVFGQGVRAFFSQYSADAIDLAIRRSPNQLERDRAGLHLSSMDANPTAREEAFASNLADRLPVFGAVSRASNRNMTTVLNLLRAEAFDRFLDANPTATPLQKKAIAEWINIASGRGNLGRFAGATKQLNLLFFAPRFAASRFQVFTHPLRHIKDPVIRKEIAKDWGAFVTSGLTVLALASLAGADVGLDPESPDFGKIKIGDTRVDIWAGLQQPVRLTMQPFLAAGDRMGAVELEKEIDLIDAGRRFLSYKLSPAVTLPAELATGRTIVGEDREAYETLMRSVVPLTVESTYETYQNTEDPTKALAAFMLNFVGVGTSEQEEKPKRRTEQ